MESAEQTVQVGDIVYVPASLKGKTAWWRLTLTAYGRALTVVRADKAGAITVPVTDGKQTGTVEITVN